MSNQRLPIVILASGAGSVAQALIDAVIDPHGALHQKLVIARVITENPGAGIVERAHRAGLATSLVEFHKEQDRSVWEDQLREVIEEVDPWLVVSAGFMKILSPTFVERFRIINTHPSLLPLFPGAHAVRDAVAAGAKESGCTLHFVDAGVDTGAVIAQRRIEIRPGESVESLHERIKELERELIVTGILSLAQLEEGQ